MGLTVNDLTDIIAGFLFDDKKPAALYQKKTVKSLGKRVFLSDYDLRKMLAPGEKNLKVPTNAIISPLSLDWIDFNGIKVVYKD
ncbi:MAG: hypothetical protein KKD35_08460 [Elusimicrobia bacterium]|nr:hypothetical protein [Elusimicrobiota bacterium]